MTTSDTMSSAGLIFGGLRDLDIVKISNRVSSVFEALEQNVTGVRILSSDRACISSCHHNVTIQVLEDQKIEGLPKPAPMVLEVAIEEPNATLPGHTPHTDTVLAQALKSLQWLLSADQIKWTTPGVVLDSADFALATREPEPPALPPEPQITIERGTAGLVERRYTFPNVDETNEQLHRRLSQKAVQTIESEKQAAFLASFWCDAEMPRRRVMKKDNEDQREETAPLRLSTWFISYTVLLFSLPVGTALLVYNFLKGENLRLSAQVTALTGTFITLETYGAFAETMVVIKSLIG